MNVQIQGGYDGPSAGVSMAMRMKKKKDQMITSGQIQTPQFVSTGSLYN